jgi:threonine synthase
MSEFAFQRCIHPQCGATADLADTAFRCHKCGGLRDVGYDWGRLPVPASLRHFESKWADRTHPLNFSGVWRFRELLPFAPDDLVMSIGEGQTLCQRADPVAAYVGMRPGGLYLQYEGMNPSGSFKDNGMTAAFTHARTIAYGKLAQALDHGALTLQIAGDFDDALRRVQEVSRQLGIYLVNSVNPFRLEGQKTIMLRVLEALRWEVPDWVVVPGGNLGNVSAFGKAFTELTELGLIPKPPRLAVINASGADTFYQLYEKHGLRWNGGRPDEAKVAAYLKMLDDSGRRADTLASAIEINRPVNLPKALRALDRCGGVVREVTDQEILDAKAKVGAGGLGCEPASGASVAGALKLVREGVIGPDERVVCILTGHQLKDPTATVAYHTSDPKTFDETLGRRGVRRVAFANRAVQVPNDLDEIVKAIELYA